MEVQQDCGIETPLNCSNLTEEEWQAIRYLIEFSLKRQIRVLLQLFGIGYRKVEYWKVANKLLSNKNVYKRIEFNRKDND